MKIAECRRKEDLWRGGHDIGSVLEGGHHQPEKWYEGDGRRDPDDRQFEQPAYPAGTVEKIQGTHAAVLATRVMNFIITNVMTKLMKNSKATTAEPYPRFQKAKFTL